MKQHYFEQPAADADDVELQAAIREGHVPPTCLLGGVLVSGQRYGEACKGCDGPRDTCGGGPKADGSRPATVPLPAGDSARARKIRREQHADEIRKIWLERDRDV